MGVLLNKDHTDGRQMAWALLTFPLPFSGTDYFSRQSRGCVYPIRFSECNQSSWELLQKYIRWRGVSDSYQHCWTVVFYHPLWARQVGCFLMWPSPGLHLQYCLWEHPRMSHLVSDEGFVDLSWVQFPLNFHLLHKSQHGFVDGICRSPADREQLLQSGFLAPAHKTS